MSTFLFQNQMTYLFHLSEPDTRDQHRNQVHCLCVQQPCRILCSIWFHPASRSYGLPSHSSCIRIRNTCASDKSHPHRICSYAPPYHWTYRTPCISASDGYCQLDNLHPRCVLKVEARQNPLSLYCLHCLRSSSYIPSMTSTLYFPVLYRLRPLHHDELGYDY